MSDRPTRISKRMPSEIVVVNVLSEPLQEHWWKMQDALDRYNVAVDEVRRSKKPSQERLKELNIAEAEGKIVNETFWLALRKQYDLWGRSLGIRDGFQVVEIPNGGMPDIIRAIVGG